MLVLVFTDGSVHDGSVGSGACAVVLLPVGNDNSFEYCVSKAVGKRVTSLTCELEGIVYGLERSIISRSANIPVEE